MKKSKFSKLLAVLSAFALAASSTGLTASAFEEESGESTEFADPAELLELAEPAELAAEEPTGEPSPTPDVLSYKEEIMPDGSISRKLYHSDGTLFVPSYETTEQIDRFSDMQTKNLPAAYDARNYNLITPVGNQATSGMCWAYGTLASVESNMLKRGLGSANFSENHLSWFTKGKYNSNKNDLTYGDGKSLNFGTGVNGAYGTHSAGVPNIQTSAMKLASWSGPVKESYDKSLEHKGWWDGAISESYRNVSDIHVQDVDIIQSNLSKINVSTRNLMKSFIMEKGVITIGYYATSGTDAIPYYSQTNYAYFSGGKFPYTNHIVSVVGWDDNFSRTKFTSTNRPNSDGAWIVKNSWGTSYGKNGYFYLSYEEPLDCIASFQVESKNNYKKVYQYDSTYGSVLGSTDFPVSSAHIFTATEDGTISAASFGFDGAYNTPYTVRVYKGVTAGKPSSGTLAVSESGTSVYPGYHTHELSKPVSIKKGERFSVVVSLNKANSWFWVDDYCYSANESFITRTTSISSSTTWDDTYNLTYERTVYTGQGYYIDDNGDPIVDDYGNVKFAEGKEYELYKTGTYRGDVCIKAFTKNDVKPALPTGLTLSAGDGQITASWNAVSGADYYTVFTYYNGKYTKVGTPVSTKYTIKGLKNGTKYGVLVLATNSAGSSAFTKSDIKCATPMSSAKPALPTGLTLSAGNGSITASWNAVSGAKYYTVFTYYGGKYTKVGTPVSTKYTITGLKNGTKYGVLVLATNAAGNSAFTKYDVKFATPMSASKPALPTGLTLTPGNGSITASWNAVSGAKYYTVFTYYGGKYSKVGTPTSTKFTITGLKNGTKYGVLVLATNAAGNSAFTKYDVKFATPMSVSKPALPTGLKLTPGNGSITASWNAVSGASYYTVYTYYGGKYSKVGTPTATKFTITGLTNGVKYGVLVLATNAAGSSAFTKSDVKCATPSAASTAVPAAPTNLIALTGDTSVTLSWSASSGATGYEVWIKDNSTNDYICLGTTTDTCVDIIELENNIYYSFRVYAYNANGKSSAAVVIGCGRHFNAPVVKQNSIWASDDVNGTLHLTWDCISYCAGYQIQYYDPSTGKTVTIDITDPSTTRYIFSNLAVGKTYTFYVRAYKENSVGDWGQFSYTVV